MERFKGFLKVFMFLIGYVIVELLFNALVGFGFTVFNMRNVPWILFFFVRLLLVVGYLILFRRWTRNQDQQLWPTNGIKSNSTQLFLGLLVGGGAIGVVICLRSMLGLVEHLQLMDWLNNLGGIILYFGVTGITVFIEEFIFRGTLYVMLERMMKTRVVPAMITSIIFALFHMGSGRSLGLLDILFFFMISFFLCYLMELTQTVWTGIGFHIGWNFLSSGGEIFSIQYKQVLLEQILWAKVVSLSTIILGIVAVCLFLRESNPIKTTLVKVGE